MKKYRITFSVHEGKTGPGNNRMIMLYREGESMEAVFETTKQEVIGQVGKENVGWMSIFSADVWDYQD
jgi:hypothetical protein